MEFAPDFIALSHDSPPELASRGVQAPIPSSVAAVEAPVAVSDPSVPDYGAEFRVAAASVTDALPEGTRRLEAQKALVIRQTEQLRAILAKQKGLTGCHPLLPDPSVQPAAQHSAQEVEVKTEAQDVQPGAEIPAAAAVANPETSPAGRASRLTLAAEQSCLAVFSLQDTLSDADAAKLAEQVGCGVEQVQEYFARLRSSVRELLQAKQRRAAGIGATLATPAPSGAAKVSSRSGKDKPAEAAHVLDEARAAGILKLTANQNTEGGIASTASADTVVALMVSEQSWSVREACLRAMSATRSYLVLKRLTAAKRLLSLLAEWASQAEAQERVSMLRSLLKALRRLDLRARHPIPRSLSTALVRLHKHRSSAVATLALHLSQRLGLLELKANSSPAAQQGWVALHSTQPERQHSHAPPPSRKRAAEGPVVLEGSAEKPAKRAATGGNLVQIEAAPVSSLAEQTALQLDALERVLEGYKQEEARLELLRRKRALTDEEEARRAAADAGLQGFVSMTDAAAFPPPELADFAELQGFWLGRGGDSLERQRLGRNSLPWRANSGSLRDTPASPESEPGEERLQRPTACIPSVSVEPAEAAEELQLIQGSGVLIPALLKLPQPRKSAAY